MKHKFKSLRLVHVKREFNQAADYLTSKTLMLGASGTVSDEAEKRHLEQVSKIRERLVKEPGTPAQVEAQNEVGTPGKDLRTTRDVEGRSIVDEIPSAETAPLTHAAMTLSGSHLDDSVRPLRLQTSSLGMPAVYCTDWPVLPEIARATLWDEPRLVVPNGLRPDMLHYAHEDYQGGHQGITRTYERLRSEFYWPGMYSDVECFVKECVDCQSGKGRLPNPGPSPGNIEPRRSFEVVSMDFVIHKPNSARGNTFLLQFQDAFSGFVMCKPMSSTTAQDVAEAYEECVFRRFGASFMLRHDQDTCPGGGIRHDFAVNIYGLRSAGHGQRFTPPEARVISIPVSTGCTKRTTGVSSFVVYGNEPGSRSVCIKLLDNRPCESTQYCQIFNL
ncbi:unnamed protein product [Phytophthora lilii]|uniref:Unnamed protein product n=1 Tax=Phytophthora lilii TaxID=2077276 RepID=A0A9W7D9S5_9STRA|nr:unnamed protein product [Phytophthora lilii]